MKIDAKIYGSHNPYGEYHWVSRLRENFTSGSEGEGLETGNLAPRQSFTRQIFFRWIKQNLKIKAFIGESRNAVMTQVYVALIAYLLLCMFKFMAKISVSLQSLLRVIQLNMFRRCSLKELFEPPTSKANFKHDNKQLLFNNF